MSAVASSKTKKVNVARHRIRFPVARETASLETAVQEVQVLIRAKNGWTTEAIANDLGLSKGQVAYRIAKGLAIGDRAAFRSGSTWVAQRCLQVTAGEIIRQVEKTVSVKYR